MFWIDLKKVEAIISTEISLNAQAIHEMTSSSNRNHGYSLPSSPSIIVGTLRFTELRPIFKELELN